MKIIKSLDSFDLNEAMSPEKSKMRFEISSNLRKVARIQKSLIDVHQLLTEMSDEIVALKMTYDKLDNESKLTIDKMKGNIDNMLDSLKRETDKGSETGMMDNTERLSRNLGRLKQGFIQRKGVK